MAAISGEIVGGKVGFVFGGPFGIMVGADAGAIAWKL